jgi:hypothetical protein
MNGMYFSEEVMALSSNQNPILLDMMLDLNQWQLEISKMMVCWILLLLVTAVIMPKFFDRLVH